MAADADVDEEGRIIIFARLACAIIMTVHHDGITMASQWHCSDASNEMPQLMIFCVCFCHITLQLRRVKRKNLVSRTC